MIFGVVVIFFLTAANFAGEGVVGGGVCGGGRVSKKLCSLNFLISFKIRANCKMSRMCSRELLVTALARSAGLSGRLIKVTLSEKRS